MLEQVNKPFMALFTHNGHHRGFTNLLAWSDTIQTIGLGEAGNNNQPLIPLLSYDYKNQVEALQSQNVCGYQAPDLLLIAPGHFVFPGDNDMRQWLVPDPAVKLPQVNIQARITRNQYLHAVKALMQHIQQGDIYEVNFCMEFYAENVELEAFELFKQYNALSKAPMACYIKYNHLHLICGSPERFIKKTGHTLISQPIKGTRKRSTNEAEDERLKNELRDDPKERAENIMIVDLVRNDLARFAQRGSVQVSELCGIYAFENVYQSISTITCAVDPAAGLREILQASFPMGSMTGAPKIRAMQLIEQYENTKRQWYSGSTGYILPGGDFDLNVIIRSMVYDQKNKYLSFEVGSAITAGSSPEKEYEECLLKAQTMMQTLNAKPL